ncbi:MAG: hypothetical protein DWQ47_15810 [Acidobacteria bacterium]|nr:MAG: hypothetical protein DWQ32_03210 [Acidobacteriota bacterium]REK02476.1 MAG: hypothetical protein DWQ38_08925 [Acidobacteriota bacterium]REK13722.1 MAG: hypothetical protein DWQ43_08900 [Acidobacteriota bacterium]REK41716.1 MAG: hypothetical protein DWQ47_15810 [Acidobacteriota bacterium]
MDERWRAAIEELNHRLVEEYAGREDLFDKLRSVQEDLGLLYDGRPTIPFLRPHFLSRKLYNKVMLAAETVAAAGEVLTEAALKDDELLSRFDLTEIEKRLVRVDPGYSVTCANGRLDTFFDGDDFSFLEYNAETPSGPSDQRQIEKVLSHIPLLQAFLDETPHWTPKPRPKLLQTLFTCYREHGGRERKPNIAIVDWDGVETEPEFYVLKDYFESMGFRTLVADPGELEYNGKALHAGPFRVDILYKRVLIHELLEKYAGDHPIVHAYEAGDLCMINSFRVKVLHKKMSFAIFSDPQYESLFTSEQIAVLREHIPWTRKVEDSETTYLDHPVELLKLLRKHRERFVLKPNDDYGGKGVVLGWECSESEWDDAIQEALNDTFVVQEKAPVLQEAFPMYAEDLSLETLLVDFDPYLFRNHAEGGMVRLSASSLVNVTQGGGQTALFVLEG